MSYTVLARRYRSATFDEVVGQTHVAQTLKKAIASGRIAHAYLFCGTRGTGKTSMARILAKALNCKSSDRPTPDPCGECDSCRAIASGDDIDVVEIDAASNTQVEKTREVVIENAGYRPLHGRFKVYIIDEAHMLSKSSFNALLKTLEEPPSHVKFILATTEPEKLPATILSRCQRYDFRNIATRQIAEHLRRVCEQEKVSADDDALLLVARAGAGSMRDALSLLDRLLSLGETKLTVATIEQVLGLPQSQLICELAGAIAGGDPGAVLTRADAMLAGGLSADTLAGTLSDHLRNLLVLRTCGRDSGLVEVPGLALDELVAQASRFDPAVLAQDIIVLEELRRQMRQSSAGRALMDAALVRLALAEQFAPIGDVLANLDSAGASPSSPSSPPRDQKKKPEDTGLRSPPPRPAPPVAPAPVTKAPAPAQPAEDDDLPRPGKVWDNSGPSAADLLRQHLASQAPQSTPTPPPAAKTTSEQPSAPAAPASNVEPVDPADLPAVQRAFLEVLATRGPALHALLAAGEYTGIRENQAVIRYPAQHATFLRILEKNGKKDQIKLVMSQVVGRDVGVKFEVEPPPAAEADASGVAEPAGQPKPASRPANRPQQPAPAARAAPVAPPPPAARPTAEQIEALKASDGLVRALVDELGAQVLRIE